MTLLRALDFAAKKHKSQRRKDNITPYINHTIGVALILEQAGIDDIKVHMAAILHDTIEDTDTTYAELENEFGVQVATLVKSVTDDTTLTSDERKQAQIDKMKTSSIETRCIKMADRIYNLRDMKGVWTEEKQASYKIWGQKLLSVCQGSNSTLEKCLLRECT